MTDTTTNCRVGSDRMSPRAFLAWLGGIAVVGLIVRVVFVLVRQSSVVLVTGDAYWYHFQAQLVADGRGFLHPFDYFVDGVVAPGADHPPGFVLILALLDVLGISTPQGQRLVMCLVGTATVVLVGVLGRRLAGDRVALVAAGFAALYPNFWINDGMLMVETVYMLASVVALLGCYSYLARPRWGSLVVTSVALVVAGLHRPEALALFALMVLPMVWGRRTLPVPLRIGHLAAAAGIVVVAFAPWAAYNQARFDAFVPISTGAGQTLVAANCDLTYSGQALGFYDTKCLLAPQIEEPTTTNRSERDRQYNAIARAYMAEHVGELPRVVAARVGRLWHLFRPGQSLGLDGFIEGRAGGPPGSSFWPVREALWSYFVLAPTSLVGLWILHRRGRRIYPMLAQPVLATVVAATTFGITRYRAGAEITIVVAAAVAVVAAVDWLLGRRVTAPAVGAPDDGLPDPPSGEVEDGPGSGGGSGDAPGRGARAVGAGT